jgi:GxxExxY protein
MDQHRGTEVAETNSALTGKIIGAAIEVHRVLGPGLLESAYQTCLCHELQLNGIGFRTEVPIGIEYKGVGLNCGYRADLLIENAVFVELKSVAALEPIHTAQMLTYLRLTRKRVGLLINFNVSVLHKGLKRIING